MGGHIFQQVDGAPIGDVISGDVADIEIELWAREVVEVLEKNKVASKLLASFMDDIRFYLRALKRGVKYNKETKVIYMDKYPDIDEHMTD